MQVVIPGYAAVPDGWQERDGGRYVRQTTARLGRYPPNSKPPAEISILW